VIFAAPASLCLVGYMNAFTDKNPIMIYLLSALSIISKVMNMIIFAVVMYVLMRYTFLLVKKYDVKEPVKQTA